MKIKLSPEIAYLIGFWRKRRLYDGLGVVGGPEMQEIFVKGAIDNCLTTPEKMISNEKGLLFHHSAYKRFFFEIEQDQLERFKYLNEYAANYLAGTFDSVGEIDDKGRVFLMKTNHQDEMLLIRLGFGAIRKKDILLIGKPVAFLTFIKNYVKKYKDHKVFEYLKDKAKKGKQKEKDCKVAEACIQKQATNL
ncbi:MAG: hypothetical protein ABII22_05770 [Candidatus Micrarchaeota archaeon]